MHGVDRTPIEVMAVRLGKPHPPCLVRIDLQLSDIGMARDQLKRLGLNHSAMFPDLDNYVKDLAERHSF